MLTERRRMIIVNFDSDNYQEHYHCLLCGKYCLTGDESKECYKTHDEIDILRFIAFRLYSTLTQDHDIKYSKKVNRLFGKIYKSDWFKGIIVDAVERFNIEEPEEYLYKQAHTYKEM
jgi:hypothetical protein